LTGLPPAPESWEFVFIGLHPPREELEARIKERTGEMLRLGLIEETQALLDSGVSAGCPPMSSIGYIQARAVLDGGMTPGKARDEISLRTRQYAKRQRTWFYNQINAQWYESFSQICIASVRRLLEEGK
jgi:tRNA dimethylallyltransferase